MLNPLMLIPATIGLGVSLYIWRQKSRQEPLVCIIGSKECSKVVYSEYSKTLGVPNELAGVAYYGVVALAAISSLYVPFFQMPVVQLLLMAASAISVCFSLYLVFVQAFILKEWCEWCLVSTVTSTTILLMLLFF